MRVRALALVLVLGGCGKPPPRPTDITTIPTNAPDAAVAPAEAGSNTAAAGSWKAGPGNFPVPSDADEGTQMIHDDITFQIPRERDEIYAQLLVKLKADGYIVDDEQFVMGGHRMNIHQGAQKYYVSVTENGESTLMTITVK